MRPGGKFPRFLKSYRLSRLFRAPTRRCVGISFASVRSESESVISARIRELALTGIEALHLPLGLASHLQSLELPARPALIVQADVTNVTGSLLPATPFCRTIDNLAEHAVRADATCISARLFEVPEAPALAVQCLRNIQRLKSACDRFCIPMLIDCRTPGPALIRRALDAGADIVTLGAPNDLAALPDSARNTPFLVRLRATAQDLPHSAARSFAAGASGILLTAADFPAEILPETARTIHAAAHGGTPTKP